MPIKRIYHAGLGRWLSWEGMVTRRGTRTFRGADYPIHHFGKSIRAGYFPLFCVYMIFLLTFKNKASMYLSPCSYFLINFVPQPPKRTWIQLLPSLLS